MILNLCLQDYNPYRFLFYFIEHQNENRTFIVRTIVIRYIGGKYPQFMTRVICW